MSIKENFQNGFGYFWGKLIQKKNKRLKYDFLVKLIDLEPKGCISSERFETLEVLAEEIVNGNTREDDVF